MFREETALPSLPVLAELGEALLGVPELRVRVPELALRQHQLLARLRQLLLRPLQLRVRLEEVQPAKGFNGLRSLNRFNNAEKMGMPHAEMSVFIIITIQWRHD